MTAIAVSTFLIFEALDPRARSNCCDIRLVQIRNQAEPPELIPKYVYEEPS
jgi:hypothetical protein